MFYDGRLSGDGSTSCATCHDPNDAFADGKPLSDGYSRGNLYFRNTPTLLNASKMPVYDWDGRLAQGDLATVVRDHIAEAHFMNLDGRLLVERMWQVPEYEDGFKQQLGSEVSYGKVLNAVVAYIRTLESSADNPYVAHTAGDQTLERPAGTLRSNHWASPTRSLPTWSRSSKASPVPLIHRTSLNCLPTSLGPWV